MGNQEQLWASHNDLWIKRNNGAYKQKQMILMIPLIFHISINKQTERKWWICFRMCDCRKYIHMTWFVYKIFWLNLTRTCCMHSVNDTKGKSFHDIRLLRLLNNGSNRFAPSNIICSNRKMNLIVCMLEGRKLFQFEGNYRELFQFEENYTESWNKLKVTVQKNFGSLFKKKHSSLLDNRKTIFRKLMA